MERSSPKEVQYLTGRGIPNSMSFLASVVLGLLLLFHGEQGQRLTRESASQSSGRHFTVKDSIEMARFERGGGEPVLSPDKKYFATVTSRGLLSSNEIESTLWLLSSREVRESLRASGVTTVLVPRILARLAAIPRLEYLNSYELLITNVRWAPDSQSVFFLGQNSRGKRQLNQADVRSGAVHTLTPVDYDVIQFEFAGSNIAYVAAPPGKSKPAGETINSDARDVTGVPLRSILFPDMTDRQEPNELWLVSKGKNHRVIDQNTRQPVRVPKFPPVPTSVLSPSSDGRTAIVLVPLKAIPSSWELYEPPFPYLKINSKDTNRAAIFWPSQYVAVNLNTGKTEVLVNAPNAWALGSADTNQAVWSSDGRRLLLTNTYLPLEGLDEREVSKRLHYCRATVVEVVSNASSCLVFSTYDTSEQYLMAASFGESDKEVVLQFSNASNRTTEERYVYKNGAWQSAGPPTDRDNQGRGPIHGQAESADLSLAIKQDLNTPPALWATDRKTGKSKEIWDPNPQLATFDLGEVSEFRWKDKEGYEWIGGLVKPPDYVPGKRYPLVIQTHGFVEEEFMTDGAYTTASAARPLASAGIVVLQVPTRNDHLVTGDEASDQIEGFDSAIERLTTDGVVDPKRVGIIGFSRTCYYVESALIRDPNQFVAATIADGVDESYVQYLLFGLGQSHDEAPQIYGGTPFGEGLKTWTEHAPGFHLDRVQTPLRIETITPASVLEEWEIYASLSKQGKPVDLIYFPDGQHILQKPLDRMASQQGNVDWFRFWLKGEEDPDPSKADQYTRWRELRKLQGQNQNKTPTN